MDLSTTLKYVLPVATLLFSILLKIAVIMFQAARLKLSGLVYHSLITCHQRLVVAVHHKSSSALNFRKIGWIVGFLPFVSATSKIFEGNNGNILGKADKLYNEHSYKKLYELLTSSKDESDAELLWRLARATYEMAKLASSPSQQKAMDFEAFGYIEQALSLDPNNFAVQKWMFILLDKKSSYEGLKARISQSFIVKQHIERACELNPNDGTSLHLLGYWCFSVAELPWYQRQIASTLFATPPVSSYSEALQYFLQAEAVEPNFYSMNLLLIGKTYMRLKDKDNAIAYLTRAKDFPATTAEDAEAKDVAAKLLASL